MKTILIITSITLYFTTCFSQNKAQIRMIDSLEYIKEKASLKNEYSKNKTFVKEHEFATLVALSYFPELKDTKIIFKPSKIKTNFNARPKVMSLLFCSKSNRRYIIRMNNQISDSIIQFNDIPFNAKIGLLGHEFTHIMDYSQRNFFQIIDRLLSYSSKKKKTIFENEIDSLTIEKGLGWQLYDWSKFVLEESNAKSKYKEFKKEVYLTPNQIKSIMNSKQ